MGLWASGAETNHEDWSVSEIRRPAVEKFE